MKTGVGLAWGLLLALVVAAPVSAIYPEGHFDYVTKITDASQLDSFVQDSIDQDQTVLAPAWNRATRAFQGNNNVVFGDVNLQEANIRGAPHNPGANGWPTVRYFNKETGVAGADYEKKTTKPVCDELGDLDTMIDFVEKAGNTVLCSLDGTNCTPQELGFIAKMKAKSSKELSAEMKRLANMKLETMKADLQEWNFRRRRILARLLAESGKADEL